MGITVIEFVNLFAPSGKQAIPTLKEAVDLKTVYVGLCAETKAFDDSCDIEKIGKMDIESIRRIKQNADKLNASHLELETKINATLKKLNDQNNFPDDEYVLSKFKEITNTSHNGYKDCVKFKDGQPAINAKKNQAVGLLTKMRTNLQTSKETLDRFTKLQLPAEAVSAPEAKADPAAKKPLVAEQSRFLAPPVDNKDSKDKKEAQKASPAKQAVVR